MARKLDLNVVICVLLVVILIVSILGMERSIKAAPYSHHILDAVVEEEDSTNFNENFYSRKKKKRGSRKYRDKKKAKIFPRNPRKQSKNIAKNITNFSRNMYP